MSKISAHDKKSQELRRQFNVFDPEEQGIIKTDKLGQLLQNLGSKVTPFQVKHHFDTGDVILWTDFERIWKMLENESNWGWNCLVCTFWNKMDAIRCEMCNGLKNDAALIEKPREKDLNKKAEDAKDAPPDKFTMYLYNGLKATKRDRPQLTKLSVWADAEIQQYHSESEELQSLIRCKFPYAIVEYAGAFGQMH